MLAKLRRVRAELGELTAEHIEVALKFRPLLVGLARGGGLVLLIAELGRGVVLHVSPH